MENKNNTYDFEKLKNFKDSKLIQELYDFQNKKKYFEKP